MAGVLRYVPLVLTFVAALVALLGPRDGSKSGLAAITAVGYVAAATAAIGLLVGVRTIWQQEQEERRLKARTSARRDRALDEIDSSVGKLFWAVHRVAYFASETVRERYPMVGWELLLSDEVLADLEEFDMVHVFPPPHMSGPYAFPLGTDTRGLVDLVTEEGHAGRDRLNAIADLTGEVLDAEEIEALGRLCTHPFMSWMANLREHFAKIRHIEDSDRYLVSLIPRHVALGGTPGDFRDFAANAIWLRDRAVTHRSSALETG